MFPSVPPTGSPLSPLVGPTQPPVQRIPWRLVVIGLILFLVPVVLAIQIVLVKRLGTRPVPYRDVVEEPDDPVERSPTAARRPTLDDPGSAPPAPESDPLLEVVASLTGAHLYQTYLNIGLLADAVETELYEREEGEKWLGTVTATLDAVDQQLGRIPVTRLKAGQHKHLVRVKELSALLRVQTVELRKYWETGKKEHADLFQKARTDTWKGMEDLQEGKD
jgi:hypothetical protein